MEIKEVTALLAEGRLLDLLRDIPGWPLDPAVDLDYLRRLQAEFRLDFSAEFHAFRSHVLDKPIKPKDKPCSRLHTWCRNRPGIGHGDGRSRLTVRREIVMNGVRPIPPPEQRHRYTETDLDRLHPLVHEETEHQLHTFYSPMDRAAEAQARRCIYHGIRRLLAGGVARVGTGGIEFWNPLESFFQEYDEVYNTVMLGVMADYQTRYRQALAVGDAYTGSRSN